MSEKNKKNGRWKMEERREERFSRYAIKAMEISLISIPGEKGLQNQFGEGFGEITFKAKTNNHLFLFQ